MFRKAMYALVIFLIVSFACFLIGDLLVALGTHFTTTVGVFLSENCGIIGALTAIWWYFWGHDRLVDHY